AELVSKVLGDKKVGVKDNFFDLGATSLQLVSLQRRLVETFSMEVNIADIFNNPNISALSGYLSGSDNSQAIFEAAERRAQLRKQRSAKRGQA
ncbi:MAG: acyl carrier protein, partial [Deltaproteobacteria bacterium]|nr:acyl carrier protein [Deltaproteobacteria bacterium]